MDKLKVIRTVCLFTDRPGEEAIITLEHLSLALASRGFTVQTQRMCSPNIQEVFSLDQGSDKPTLFSIGSLSLATAQVILPQFLNAKHVNFNVDLTNQDIQAQHTALLMEIIQKNAVKTFNFTYTFNNAPSTPYFPSASYERAGFSIGLQPTDLSAGCMTIEEWLAKMNEAWSEIHSLFSSEEGYLGIDTSIAPLFRGQSSFLNFVKRMGLDFSRSVTTDVFIRIARYIKEQGLKNVGLCGLMFPCLEDFELAAEYEQGKFSIERNAFLALHSGLGIDSYPIGVDEQLERITEVLKLIGGLSEKYKKPLSARFVSDGKTKIGQRTNFGNPYLMDVVIKPL